MIKLQDLPVCNNKESRRRIEERVAEPASTEKGLSWERRACYHKFSVADTLEQRYTDKPIVTSCNTVVHPAN